MKSDPSANFFPADLKKNGVEIFRLADRLTVLRDGRHIATCPASETNEAALIRLLLFPKKRSRSGVDHLSLGE